MVNNNLGVVALSKFKINDEYQRYNNALMSLAKLPEFDYILKYWKMNYLDPNPASSNLVTLGSNLGKMELVKEIIHLSENKVGKIITEVNYDE